VGGHVAIQGPGFFLLRRPLDAPDDPNAELFLTRDGDFRRQTIAVRHPIANGSYVDTTNPMLVHSSGLVAVSYLTGIGESGLPYDLVEDNLGLPPVFGTGGLLNPSTYGSVGFALDMQVVTVNDSLALQYSQ
jgi:hypothetical protein